jgi:hypothetical protein
MAEFRPSLAEQLLSKPANTGAKPSDDLEARLDRDDAPIWHPQPGDRLIGEVIEMTWREGDYGIHPFIVMRDDNGDETAVRTSATVLRNGLQRQRVQVGDRVALQYRGERKSQSGRSTYHDYRVLKTQRADGDFWAQADEEGNPPF